MNKRPTAYSARTDVGFTNCDQMSQKVSNRNHVTLRADNRLQHGTTHGLETRGHPFSTVSTLNVSPHSPQWRWSTDFCNCGTSSVITVKKNKKEPQPPQRSVSLPEHNTPFQSSLQVLKRYSLPPSSGRGYSSSSSSNSSCYSPPPPIKTSAIIGPDPLGWKIQPKTSSPVQHARSKRLSLQISLPVIFPDPILSPAPTNTLNQDLLPENKPPLRPKAHHRRYSDSSAFLAPPMVMPEQLFSVHLRPVAPSEKPNDVFSKENKDEVKMTTRPPKTPPPVPEKTATTKKIAKGIAHERQCCGLEPAKTKEESIYASVMKPKRKDSQQTKDHRSQYDRKTGLRVETSCDRERSTPRFPG